MKNGVQNNLDGKRRFRLSTNSTYLSENWPQSVVNDFVETCNRKIGLLEIVPHIGVASRINPSVRKLLITKHNALYYSVVGNEVTLLDFFDTRQDPSKDPFQ